MKEEKRIRFEDWQELLKAVPGYLKLGYRCEVRGWDDARDNVLTITDGLEDKEHDERNDAGRVACRGKEKIWG